MNNYQKLILRLNAKILKLAKRLSKNKLRQEKLNELIKNNNKFLPPLEAKENHYKDLLFKLENYDFEIKEITNEALKGAGILTLIFFAYTVAAIVIFKDLSLIAGFWTYLVWNIALAAASILAVTTKTKELRELKKNYSQEKLTEQLNEVLSQIAEIKKKNAMANEILTNLKNEESYLQKITEKLFSKKQSVVHNYRQVLAMPSIAQKINRKFIAEPIMIKSRKRDINGSI